MSPVYQPSAELERVARRWRSRLLAGGILLIAISIVGAFFAPRDFFHGYLIGFLFWLGATLGSLAFLMLQYLTGGAWGIISRRPFEAAARTLPIVAVFFIPLAFGLPYLYDWAHPDLVRHDPLLQHRAAYMNPAMFLLRAVVYFAIWWTFTRLLSKWSAQQDAAPGDQPTLFAKLSAPGLIVYVFTIFFASVDWAESLVTKWYSTMWGFLFVANQGLTAIAFVIVVLWLLSRYEPASRILRPSHFHDLGKLLLMMLMLWAYFAFAQLLIVWAGDLPHEISFYLPRFQTSWGWLGAALILVQFMIPFLLLLSLPLKRNAALLSAVAILVLFMRYMDLVWIVLPNDRNHGFSVDWMAITAPLGLGGIWLWAFLAELVKLPLVPVNAPQLEAALAHETE